MTDLASNIVNVREEISRAACAVNRHPSDITLIAVSKTRSADEITAAAAAGVRHFGENYLQEAAPKIRELADLGLQWHYIGRLQSNKTAEVAGLFDWVHTLDQEKHARRLDAQRPPNRPALNVCLQVNISGEQQKGGVHPDGVAQLAEAILSLPQLRLRGLMGMAAAGCDETAQMHSFDQLLGLFLELHRSVRGLDTLSMGMSGDFPAAIRCGATMVRIGSAIFGERHYSAAQISGEG